MSNSNTGDYGHVTVLGMVPYTVYLHRRREYVVYGRLASFGRHAPWRCRTATELRCKLLALRLKGDPVAPALLNTLRTFAATRGEQG